MHSQACSQNKGLSKYQRKVSQLQIGPSPHQRHRGRRVTARAIRRGATSARDGILHQTVSRLPVANQIFLGFWTVDICQEDHTQRSDVQRRHTAHLRWCSHSAPRKLSGWDQQGD